MQNFLYLKLAALGAYVIGVFCFHAENSDYPYYYNADEPAKARQVTTGKWNFHHPMALLSIAGLITDESLTLQQATERGRRVAAAYMALGAGLLVALAGWGFGTVGAIIAAVLFVLNPEGYMSARVFKEDPALFAGMAAFVLVASMWLCREGGRWHLFILGMAAGLAAAGKYIGVFLILIMLVLIAVKKGNVEGAWRRTGIAMLGVVVVFLVANLPLFMDLGEAKLALDEELRRQMEGRFVKRDAAFHLTIFGSIWRSHDVLQWLMAGVAGIGAIVMGKGRQRTVVVMAAVVALCYAVIICFSSGYAGRYGMPWSLFVSFLSACGFGFLVYGAGKLKWRGVAWVLVVVFGLVAMRLQYRNGLRSVRKEFARDSHRDVNDWLLKHAEPGARILQSKQVGLHGADRLAKDEPPRYPAPANIETKYFACNFGSYEDLMASDIAYVAIGSKEHQRFYRVPMEKGGPANDCEEFYIELIGGGDWEQVLATPNLRVGYLHPGLYLFRRKAY